MILHTTTSPPQKKTKVFFQNSFGFQENTKVFLKNIKAFMQNTSGFFEKA